MTKNRLEAFSDGVMAIIITIMVLELKAPHGETLAALRAVVPGLLSYMLSFVYVGIYWNNHHHMFHAAERVNGGVLWANLHLLFWLSLFPFVTEWIGASHLAPLPTAAYGAMMLMAGTGYWILQYAVIKAQGPGSLLAQAVGSDSKGKVSILMYAAAVGMAWAWPALSAALYVVVALMWLVPDRRIEDRVTRNGADE